ncbi:efflux RND transporter periplasmic adaptor subunit [Breoghania sp. L-A4]|uniref:efflux RND transporter periplasmic adaptor subunit n=1 Tax=Breoghania sp. L-A4 TaxID=2304600 RepID=UPI000E35CAA5|nr:efflux RND transporter periplasmic adaptor subunit [Breoghania sp. L-A4]AXS40553.1 efflux RND transporter periplasmic adaptor subunit [Breoghania sp. L-A4]
MVVAVGCLALVAAAFLAPPVRAEEFTVARDTVQDTKVVYGTVQAAERVPARARLSGTLVELIVDEGSSVTQGEMIARIVDEKLALSRRALEARIDAARSQVANLKADYDRAATLFERGTISQARIDQLDTQLTVARNTLLATEAERAVLDQQVTEGDVLAPAAGRVLSVPVTQGSVVLPGEVIATIAIDGYILRLEVPERHARFMQVGDPVRVGRRELATQAQVGAPVEKRGRIAKLYPEIKQGRVIADATVEGLGDFFVGERARVWIDAGERAALVIPPDYVSTRHGLDFVRLARETGASLDIIVELGEPQPLAADGGPGIEVLTGLRAGDTLVKP